jgi:hypothetical protein
LAACSAVVSLAQPVRFTVRTRKIQATNSRGKRRRLIEFLVEKF